MASLWIFATLIAATAQTARNALQRSLIETVGTAGATHVRFLYGFPFALLFLGIVSLSGAKMPSHLPFAFFTWGMAGALAQIFATALMLSAMKTRSFVVTTAYTKTEPVQVALFGFVFLGDILSAQAMGAIGLATLGVLLVSNITQEKNYSSMALGLLAASFFALSAIGFRGGIRALDGAFYANATVMLVFGLGFQALVMTLYLLVFDRQALIKILHHWRPSLLAGFMGALGSQFWFIAFSLETAAKVRTLALIEVLMAQTISGKLFAVKTSRQEGLGLVLIVLGVGLLLLV
jgi:drug/metabolite transporter (DMT)-like permease